jgi:hypothetical protein
MKRNIYSSLERIRVVGGWQSVLDSQNCMRVVINEEQKIRFDTSHAGPGEISFLI